MILGIINGVIFVVKVFLSVMCVVYDKYKNLKI